MTMYTLGHIETKRLIMFHASTHLNIEMHDVLSSSLTYINELQQISSLAEHASNS